MEQIEKRREFLIRFVYWLVIAGLGYVALKYALGYVLPFALGFGLAALTQKQILRLAERMRINRKIAAAAVLTMIILGLGLLGALICTFLWNALCSGIAQLPDFVNEHILPALENAGQRLEKALARLNGNASSQLQSLLAQLPEMLRTLSEALVSKAASAAAHIPSVLISVTVTVVSAYFFAADYPAITGFIARQLRPRTKKILFSVKQFLTGTLLRLGRAYGVILVMTFVELLIGFWILGIPNFVAAAAAIALIDILPVLGTAIVLVPWAILELLQHHFFRGIGLLVLFAAVDLVRNLAEPKIVGRQTGVHPLITFICMIIGFRMFGGIGILVLPIFGVILKNLNDVGQIHIFR